MNVHAVSLATTLFLGLGAASPGQPAHTRDQGGALASYMDAPDVYVELFDLGALERDVRQSGIGRLAKRFMPLLEEHIEGDEVAEHLGLDPVALGRGDMTLEDAIATGLARLARDELGMSEGDAVRVAASLGSRLSISFEATGDDCDDGDWAVSWSLRAGGADVIVDTLAPHVSAMAGEDAPELVHMERTAGGVRAAWSVEDDEDVFVVVRSDLLAVTSSDTMVARLLGEKYESHDDRYAVGTDFELARSEVIRSGESVWVWIDGTLLRRAAAEEGEDALDAMNVLGLDRLENIQVSVSGSDGQLSSRLRLEKSGSDGLLGLLRARSSEWHGLELLTSDSFGIAGLSRSPSGLVTELAGMLAHIEDAEDVHTAVAMAQSAPLIGELLAPGALGEETVVFARPGAAGIPMVYAAMPATGQLMNSLERLQEGASAFGGELSLRRKELEGSTCWMLTEGGGHGLAVTTQGDTLIASYSLLALQDYMRQRKRESAGERDALIASVRDQMRRAQVATGNSPGDVAGFVHVRVEPLAEMVWPWMMMGMSMGGVAGLEDLPDAVEIAEEIGDTTLILFELDDAIEVRGRGLFGGLGVLF
jgi:hypothetical protein